MAEYVESNAGGQHGNGREATVRLESVTKSFGGRDAVRELSLTLHAGEVFAFLGPNGAGKTTTLRMTTGLLRPDSGDVEVCGFSMARQAREAKCHIAYVPDEPYVYDKLTGREFIHFARDMYGVERSVADARLARLVEQFDMAGFLDRLCEHYSHGMKQKVVLAAALIHAPQLLVVDEPTVGLDPRTIHVTKSIFRGVADAGGTVFMSTHALDVAETLADRIGIINDGRLVALGTMSELHALGAANRRLENIFLELTATPPRVS
ncbi:MAG: Daunorubicin/doxorubicin resistance ATP-binding protein DrrA [Phycisphaerae bacterium]|nr:Daunorubicin/doxorubicin resistance ATP-binding protein DrrA [Phycisphaerae bacterium]